MNKRFLSAILALQTMLFVSCNQQPDNTAQIKGLEDRIRQLEDEEKQLQLQNEQDKLNAERAAFDAEKQKFQEQQSAAVQVPPESTRSSSEPILPRKPVRMESDASIYGSSQPDSYRSDSYNVFYERLQSEGRWFDDDKYGYVWQPSEAESDENWRPYTDGHWAYTDRGWTWVSNENFGWATYHYGRWAKVRNVGWIWVPGNTWAPAWVSWRQTESSDYVGWAPLPPECETSPSVKVEGWVDNYYDIGPATYVFLKAVDLVRPTYRQAILPPQQNLTIIDQTRNVTNIVYNNNVVNNYGPQYQQLAQITNNRLERYQINYQQQAQPNANFRTLVNGNRVEVVAPPPQLQRRATIPPKDVRQLENTQVERGWQNIDPAKTQQLKQVFQQTAPPVPKMLPSQPAPPPRPVIASVGSSKPGQPGQQPPKSGAPLDNSRFSAERQRIEAEKAQLEQQKQVLLGGKTLPPAPEQAPPGKPGPANQLVEKPQSSPGALNQRPTAPETNAKEAASQQAQKAQQAEQARAQQEAQQRQQAAQQQQQAAADEKARQTEAQKAQQAEQARAQQEAQQRQQAAQQQQQAAAERARQAEAQKAQQAEQARAQQEAQQRQQAAQQQQAVAERARQAEAQKAQHAEQARAQLEAQQRQQAAPQQQRSAEERSKHAEGQKGEERKKDVPSPAPQQQN